jgi:dipeptidyl aminopeptidase/acylaminoacyl peptidase
VKRVQAAFAAVVILLEGCGGGGGGDTEIPTPTAPPTAECFSGYDASSTSYDPYRSNRGQIIYTRDNRDSLYSFNLANSNNVLISGELDYNSPTDISIVRNGEFIAYPWTGGSSSSYQIQEISTGQIANQNLSSNIVVLSPTNNGFVSGYFFASIVKGAPLGDWESLQIGMPNDVQWMADGNRVVANYETRIDIYDLDSLTLEHSIGLADAPEDTTRFVLAEGSPKGNRLLLVSRSSETESYSVLDLETGTLRHILEKPFVSGPNPGYAWSPSGKYLAITEWISGTPILKMYSVEENEYLPISVSTSDIYNSQWAPNRDRFLFVISDHDADERTLYLLRDPATGQSDSIQRTEEFMHFEWSPDGRFFSYQTYQNLTEYAFYTADVSLGCTRQILAFEQNSAPNLTAEWSPSGQYLLYSRYPHDGDPSHHVIRPDESDRFDIGSLLSDGFPDTDIDKIGWASNSDSLYATKVANDGIPFGKGFDILELETLTVSSSPEIGFIPFNEQMWLAPGP